MAEVFIENKEKYLNENYPFEDIPKLTDKQICIHCNRIITVGEYKVFTNETNMEFICCPNAPECNGTLIDWIPVD